MSDRSPSPPPRGTFPTEVDLGGHNSPASSSGKKGSPTASSSPPASRDHNKLEAATFTFDPSGPSALPPMAGTNLDQLMDQAIEVLPFSTTKSKCMWEKRFQSKESKAVIKDTYWWCFCHFFHSQEYDGEETEMFDRISCNFVKLFHR
jgi:hypothetical protein